MVGVAGVSEVGDAMLHSPRLSAKNSLKSLNIIEVTLGMESVEKTTFPQNYIPSGHRNWRLGFNKYISDALQNYVGNNNSCK